MQENSLPVIPRDEMLDELGNTQLLGGSMQSNDQINPSQFQDSALYPYQVTGDFPFGVSPIQDSVPFGFVGVNEIEGFSNYVGGCESLQAAGGAPEHSLGDCELSKCLEGFYKTILKSCESERVVEGAHKQVSDDFELVKAVGGAHEHVLGNGELVKAVGGAHEHVLGNGELVKAVGGAHEHVLGNSELVKAVGGAHEQVLGNCESSKTVRGAHEHVLGACESVKAVVGAHEHLDAGIAVANISGQETNWSDKMVKVLITAISYFGETHFLTYTTNSIWEAISTVMVQRGYTVTPQQCHDKFKDLKNKNVRFHAILGKDAYGVYKNPILLESMDLCDEAKVEVRNLIHCKQLFYEEMWSCLNQNRTFLPLDFPLIRSLTDALGTKLLPGSEMPSQRPSVKRKRPSEDRQGKSLATPSNATALSVAETNKELILKLHEQKAELLAKKLEFEKERFEWVRYNQNVEWEMKQTRLQNEFLKLENERLTLELQTGKSFRN